MQIEVETKRVSVDAMQEMLNLAWKRALEDPADLARIEALFGADRPIASPFVAEPGEDGFGVIELILIAAAGRLVATIPERLLVKLFDELLWPKIEARFGDGVKKRELEAKPDEPEKGDEPVKGDEG